MSLTTLTMTPFSSIRSIMFFFSFVLFLFPSQCRDYSECVQSKAVFHYPELVLGSQDARERRSALNWALVRLETIPRVLRRNRCGASQCPSWRNFCARRNIPNLLFFFLFFLLWEVVGNCDASVQVGSFYLCHINQIMTTK
jgi:hypothetical protein